MTKKSPVEACASLAQRSLRIRYTRQSACASLLRRFQAVNGSRLTARRLGRGDDDLLADLQGSRIDCRISPLEVTKAHPISLGNPAQGIPAFDPVHVAPFRNGTFPSAFRLCASRFCNRGAGRGRCPAWRPVFQFGDQFLQSLREAIEPAAVFLNAPLYLVEPLLRALTQLSILPVKFHKFGPQQFKALLEAPEGSLHLRQLVRLSGDLRLESGQLALRLMPKDDACHPDNNADNRNPQGDHTGSRSGRRRYFLLQTLIEIIHAPNAIKPKRLLASDKVL